MADMTLTKPGAIRIIPDTRFYEYKDRGYENVQEKIATEMAAQKPPAQSLREDHRLDTIKNPPGVNQSEHINPVQTAALGRSGEIEGQSLNVPSLSGKNKAELLEIAEGLGLEVPEGATNDEIRALIEGGATGE